MIRELFLEDLSLWNCVWQSTLLAVVGLAGSFLLRHRPARAFQALFLAMTAAVLVPVMSVIVKHYELGMFTAEPIALNSEMKDLSSAIPYGTSTVSSAADTQIQTREGATDIVIAKSGKENINIPWYMILLFGWLIATLVLLGRLLIAFFNGVCLLKRSKIQACEHIEQAADIARARLGITKCLLIRSNQEIRSPMIWCWCKNPVLLVPSKLDNNTDWVGVICHELAHWRRLDHISGLIAEIIVCILSWNPLLWLSKKRMVRLGEQACDDWVVAGGRPVESYARSLLDFKPQKQAAFVPAVVHSRKEMATRIRRILKDGCVNPRTGATWALVVSLVTACLAAGVAFAQTRPAKPETSSSTEEKPAKSLHEAAAKGNIEQVRLLISQGADVNAKDKNDRTPLHTVAEEGHADIAKFLIVNGADVNAKDKKGITPLHYAIYYENKDIIKLLVTKGADVNFMTKGYSPPLHFAVWNKDVESAKLLVNNGAKFNLKDPDGWTAFRYAVAGGNRELFEFFVAKGANASDFHKAAWLGDLNRVKHFVKRGTDVNTKDDQLNWTPLQWAAFTGKQDVCELLLAKGANVNAKDEWNCTPLHNAAVTGQGELVELFLAKGAKVNAKADIGKTPLHDAARGGHLEVVALLIASGADVNAKYQDGSTSLHRAAEKGYKEVVELLIVKGADVNAKDKGSYTPLHYAISYENKDIIKLLIAKGADVNSKDQNGRTPLDFVTMLGDKDIVALLINKGADINSKNQNGRTPLDVATMLGDKDMAALLIDKGADINTKNKWGNTPLHIVVGHRSDKDMAALLIAKGADVNTKNKWGNTPLHIVVDHCGDKDMAALLIAKGADVNARDDGGRTPLWYAEKKGYTEIVDLLLKHGANGAGAAVSLHQAAVKGDIEKVKPLIPPLAGVKANRNDLVGRRFGFYWTEDAEEHQNGVLLLRDDGTIGEYSHPNESTWEVDEESRVLIRHRDGRISTVLNRIAVHDGKYELRGPFLLRDGIDHILRER